MIIGREEEGEEEEGGRGDLEGGRGCRCAEVEAEEGSGWHETGASGK
jgi:hypothetical protein